MILTVACQPKLISANFRCVSRIPAWLRTTEVEIFRKRKLIELAEGFLPRLLPNSTLINAVKDVAVVQ